MPIQPLPDVVFVGTAVDSDFRTVRSADQVRRRHESVRSSGLVDVRYGIDAKYSDGAISTSSAPSTTRTSSRCARGSARGAGLRRDEVIVGATESDLECPELVDPLRRCTPMGPRSTRVSCRRSSVIATVCFVPSSSRSPSFARQCSCLPPFAGSSPASAAASSRSPRRRRRRARPRCRRRPIAPPVTSPLGLGGGDPGVLAQERRHDVVKYSARARG